MMRAHFATLWTLACCVKLLTRSFHAKHVTPMSSLKPLIFLYSSQVASSNLLSPVDLVSLLGLFLANPLH